MSLLKRFLLFIIQGLVLTQAMSCWADTYTYTNRQGTVVMTDSKESIPKQYQNKIKVIKDTSPQRQASEPAPEYSATPVHQEDLKPTETELPWYKKHAVPATYAAAILILLYAIRKFSVMAGVPRIGLLFVVVTALAAGLYFYKRYVDNALQTYQALKKDAENIKKSVEKRETMTDKSLQSVKE